MKKNDDLLDPSELQCPGFRAAGTASGIKKDGSLDLGLIVADTPVRVAAVFTKNRVWAAPLIVAKERVENNSVKAVLVNSGNANACTGDGGISDAKETTDHVANLLNLPTQGVIPASTGVIGANLPVDKINTASESLVSSLSPVGFLDCARAMMTTDTFPKIVKRTFSADDSNIKRGYTILGMVKGAGMIRPDMATMLSFVVTDAPLKKEVLDYALREAVKTSFNAITIDGDTSTNDIVVLMSGGDPQETTSAEITEELEKVFKENLDILLKDLARLIVKGGEGATKLVTINIKGAPDKQTASDVAFRVANSPLVKTAFFGEDPNWGRIMGAMGCIEGDFNPMKADIFFGDILLVSNGIGKGINCEKRAAEIMKNREFDITIDLKGGNSTFTVLTSDLSLDYIKINADYRS
jgi:glutamate N-acetyltransferase / amino-acid N-acetyltransferase